jgi:hypothetical protein
VGLERGPLGLASTIEELIERKSSSPGLENRNYGLGIRRADHAAPSILRRQKLALISPTRGGRPVGIVRSRTQATEDTCRRSCYEIKTELVPDGECSEAETMIR